MHQIKNIINDITHIIHNLINDITHDIAGADAGADANADAGTDAGADAGTDAGADINLFLVINTRIFTDVCGIFNTYEKAYECLLNMGSSDDIIIYKMKLNETIYDFYLTDSKRIANKTPTILYSKCK